MDEEEIFLDADEADYLLGNEFSLSPLYSQLSTLISELSTLNYCPYFSKR